MLTVRLYVAKDARTMALEREWPDVERGEDWRCLREAFGTIPGLMQKPHVFEIESPDAAAAERFMWCGQDGSLRTFVQLSSGRPFAEYWTAIQTPRRHLN